MAAHHRGEWQRLSTIPTTIPLGTCSLQHPIFVASRPIRHTTFSEFALKIITSSLPRTPDPTECPNHNTGIGGAHSAQDGTWAVKLTCTSHAQSRHHWLIRSPQSSAFASRGMATRNDSRWHSRSYENILNSPLALADIPVVTVTLGLYLAYAAASLTRVARSPPLQCQNRKSRLSTPGVSAYSNQPVRNSRFVSVLSSHLSSVAKLQTLNLALLPSESHSNHH